MRRIIEELAAEKPDLTTLEGKVATLYNAYLDTAAIEARGLAPAQPYLDRIQSIAAREDLAQVFAANGYKAPVGGWVDVDSRQTDRYVFYITQSGPGMDDRDYYLVENDRNAELPAAHETLLTSLLATAGYDDAGAAADGVIALETGIAKAHWDRAASRNRNLTYNKVTRDGLVAMAGAFPVAALIDALGLGDQSSFVVRQVTPTEEEIAENGLETQRERWKRGVDTVENSVGEAVGKVYAERYFPAENKTAMDKLIANLRTAMAGNLEVIAWMGADTKAEAEAKLNLFTPKIGYLEKFETYNSLTVSDNAFANQMAVNDWAFKDMLSDLGQPIDRTEWGMLPQTVNAYYSPNRNEIVFPAAILQPPFFNLSADPAVNYGAIGAVIGHEIGHGFDDQGSKSDGTGTLRNGWTAEDKADFKARTDALVVQFNAFCLYDEGKTCINGALTLGENTGDLGGLSMAYKACHLSLNGKDDKVFDGLTGDQRFFMSYAQVWRSKYREEA